MVFKITRFTFLTAFLIFIILANWAFCEQWPPNSWYRCPYCYHVQDNYNSGVCESCGNQYISEVGDKHDGWIKTFWDQGYHYNTKCPEIRGEQAPVGCTATAMAQIINFWEYPTSVSFSDLPKEQGGDAYDYWDKWGILPINKINIFEDSYASVNDLNNALETIDYYTDEESQSSSSARDEQAYFCFGVGAKLGMKYHKEESGIRLSADAYLEGFNYGSAIWEFKDYCIWNKYEDTIIENLKKGWPVQIGIITDGSDGHSIVVDGYKDSGVERFHTNWGWGLGYTGWINLPDTGTDYKYVQQIVYNIAPYKGWNQWGADERNSFSTLYNAPDENVIKEKWKVTCPSSHSFSGLVVGSANNIYAACSPDGTSQHPKVYMYNQFGSKTGDPIDIPENVKIEFICQETDPESSDRYVFISTENGFVYRIDTRSRTCNKIWTEPNSDDIDCLKIDSDGYLYACTLHNLYQLDCNGNEKWHYSAPGDTMFLGGGKNPAIDEKRNKVYVVYYDSNSKTPYLVQLSRASGPSFMNTRSFGSVTIPTIRTPIVGPDGTIYIGIYTTLYALNYSDINGPTKWTKNLNCRNGCLDPNGEKIYVPLWEQEDGQWYNKIRAMNTLNGDEIWEIKFQQDPSKDDIWQPYTAGNGMVCFTVETGGDPETYTVYGYQDNGNSYDKKWQFDAGTSGGDFAFGPGSTLYFWGKTGVAETIYAISQGETGKANEAGMGFTDNSSPESPHSPTPNDGATDLDIDVFLDWESGDPDFHALKYSVFVGKQGSIMVPVVTDLTNSNYTLENLEGGKLYNWQIIASDGQAITKGPTWAFTTEIEDLCPDDPNKTEPGICGCGVPDTDTDGDGAADCIDLDDDDDGLQDIIEDVNQNGAVDSGETDPLNPDSDDDGMLDGWEVQYGLDPLVDDASGDLDGDGVLNYQEYLNGTDPSRPPFLPFLPLLLED